MTATRWCCRTGFRRDGLRCLKIKLRGVDAAWDYERILKVGRIAIAHQVDWLSADFNCTVREPEYVTGLLDRVRDEAPRISGMLLYVEQPFPYDLEAHQIDVHAISARKPLFLDESAHDWRVIRLGRELGWSGVALKTCKTQSEALLSCAWPGARHDPDGPGPQQPHAGPDSSRAPGCQRRSPSWGGDQRDAVLPRHPGSKPRSSRPLLPPQRVVDLSTLRGPGFGYRLQEIARPLPPPAATFGS